MRIGQLLVRSLLVIAIDVALVRGQDASSCVALSDSKKAALTEYVRQKYKIPDSVSLTLVSDKPLRLSCFRRLSFHGKSNLKSWEMELYLSPDQRYMMDELLDTTINPADEERAKSRALMTDLSANKGASRGSANAQVTIVEFSDFECPFCRKFAGILRDVLPTEQEDVRIVFHHLPLSMHPWARIAAEAAACAQLQNSKAFWAFHDRLFQQQPQITEQNVKAQLQAIAHTVEPLDFNAFQTCLDNEMSLGLVLRDLNLAAEKHISATPTLFINGSQVQGVRDSAELRKLIAEASKQSQMGNNLSQ